MAFTNRQLLVRNERSKATEAQVPEKPSYVVPSGLTDDEKSLPAFAGSFHKLLDHEASPSLAGLLTTSGQDNYNRLLDGLQVRTSSTSDFDTDKLNGLSLLNRNPVNPDDPAGPPLRPRVLINPRSSKSVETKGVDAAALRVGNILFGPGHEDDLMKQISFRSRSTFAESVENYAMALLRDATFSELATQGSGFSQRIDLAIAALNAMRESFVWGVDGNGNRVTALDRPVTRQNLFRGPTEGDLTGDYLSIFLTAKRPPLFPSGCAADVADLIGASAFADKLGLSLQVPKGRSKDFGNTVASYVAMQNAEIPERYSDDFFSGVGPIATGRDLGNYVHVDNAYEEYIRAADILVGGQINRSTNSPYTNGSPPRYKNESDGPTLGPSDIWGVLGSVRVAAERAAWTQKWLVARRARPEVFSALVHLLDSGQNQELRNAIPDVLSALAIPAVRALLDAVREQNANANGGERNLLLSQMYPEGSPAHPAWPSGHATIAGACVTVLKAFFNEDATMKDQSGTLRRVGSELDKLASNVSLGRDWGGVHFRTDGEHGIWLGEDVAIRFLQDHARGYREQFRRCNGFTLTRRNGVTICITADSVKPIADPKPIQIFGANSANRIYHVESL